MSKKTYFFETECYSPKEEIQLEMSKNLAIAPDLMLLENKTGVTINYVVYSGSPDIADPEVLEIPPGLSVWAKIPRNRFFYPGQKVVIDDKMPKKRKTGVVYLLAKVYPHDWCSNLVHHQFSKI